MCRWDLPMALDDPNWPITAALHLYDVTTDRYKPCTQDDLDLLARRAGHGVKAMMLLGEIAHRLNAADREAALTLTREAADADG